MVGVPAEISLYVITHDPEESVHGFAVVNEPVPDDVVNQTVPVGLAPVTVTVQIVVPPAANDGHETEVPVATTDCRVIEPLEAVDAAALVLSAALTTTLLPVEVQPEKV